MYDAPPVEYPIKVGSMLYTLVDPHRGHEVAYNRWYERDHYYAGCMIGPWLFAGSRWVATRELKDLRFPKDDTNAVADPWDAGSYVAIYWVLEGHFDEHFNDWAIKQVRWLYSNDRGFAERSHVHTVLYRIAGAFYRDADPVPIDLALDHGYEGLVSVALDRVDGVSADQLDAWLRAEGLPPALADGGPVASCAVWTPEPREGGPANAPMALGSEPGGPERTMQLFFVDGDVRDAWPRFVEYGERVNGSGLATVVFAAPFFRTVVGTDTYVDQLW